MKKMFNRVMALVLSLVLVLSLAACGEKVGSTDAPTDAPKTTDAPKESDAPKETEAAEFDPRSITEGVTLTIAVASDDEVIDWETNNTTLMIEEEFGVDLKFETYASADFQDKINVMVNGGDKLPDIIFGSGVNGLEAIANWASEGALIPLNEFYENPDYAKNINLACEKLGVDIPSQLKDADGNIWAAPKYIDSPVDTAAYKLWINTEYAAALGWDEIPTTTEGFYELCKAFVAAGDMNGNGIDDEVALTGRGDKLRWFKYLMSSFAYTWDDYYLDVTDGTLSFAYTSDGWKEGLKYVKRFIDEELISTTALTQDKASYSAIVTNSEAVVLADVAYLPQMINNDIAEQYKTKLKYDWVPALETPEGNKEAYYSDVTAKNGAVITVDCENPDAAFIVLDYMCSETMSITWRWGQEGVNWDYWENVDESKLPEGTTKEDYAGRLAAEYPTPVFIPYSDATFWGVGTPQNGSYMQAGPAIVGVDKVWGVAKLANGGGDEGKQAEVDMERKYAECSVDTIKYAPEERIITLPMTTEENQTAKEIQKTLDNYVNESIGAFLTGQWDIDGYWDTYLAELEKIGIDDALAIYQTSYDRTK